jgi:hypothetical protein
MVVPVKEHTLMKAGTTNSYTTGKVCVWHFQGASQYHALKRLYMNIKQSQNVTSKVVNNYVKIYNGTSFRDIVSNATSSS